MIYDEFQIQSWCFYVHVLPLAFHILRFHQIIAIGYQDVKMEDLGTTIVNVTAPGVSLALCVKQLLQTQVICFFFAYNFRVQ